MSRTVKKTPHRKVRMWAEYLGKGGAHIKPHKANRRTDKQNLVAEVGNAYR